MNNLKTLHEPTVSVLTWWQLRYDLDSLFRNESGVILLQEIIHERHERGITNRYSQFAEGRPHPGGWWNDETLTYFGTEMRRSVHKPSYLQ
jgi:hypothetical protein